MKGTLFSFVVLLCTASCFSKGIRCGKNEFLRCGECPPERTCKLRGIAFKCFMEPNCKQSCVCKEGFIRNQFNQCIPDSICDSCTGPNEFWDCGPACDNECKTIKYQNRTNCPIQNIVCNQKCYCNDGYARNAVGVCIPVDKCYSCTGPNEFWDCGPACDNECKTIKYQSRTNCPIKNIVCNQKCYCKDGYARNAVGICVPIDKCWQPTSTSPSPGCTSSGWWWFFRAGVIYAAYPDCSAAATIRQAMGLPKNKIVT